MKVLKELLEPHVHVHRDAITAMPLVMLLFPVCMPVVETLERYLAKYPKALGVCVDFDSGSS